MAWLTLFRASAVKVLSGTDTFGEILVGDEEQRNVAVSASRIGAIVDMNITSGASVETKSFEAVNAFGAILALGFEFGLGLEERDVEEKVLGEGLGGVDVQ
jgi:hypothetical protein